MKKSIYVIFLIIISVILMQVNVKAVDQTTDESSKEPNTTNTTTTTTEQTGETAPTGEEQKTSEQKNENTEPETKSETQTKVQKQTQVQQPVSTQTTRKSNNANLSDLGIKPNDFKGFKQSITSYNVKVPKSVESVELYAKTADSKAQLSGTGIKKLDNGENQLTVTVTAEDGTTKTYTVNVTREEESEENTSNTITSPSSSSSHSKGLSELKIEGITLSPSFNPAIYEYKAKYEGDDIKLNITAKPSNSSYIVDITGNKDLKEGENVITILVSEKDGTNVATYQVLLEKSLIDKETIEKEKQKQNQKIIMLICGGIGAVVLLIIIIIVIKHKRNKDNDYYEEEYEDEDEIEEIIKRENDKILNKSRNDKRNSNNDIPKKRENHAERINEKDDEEKYKEIKHKNKSHKGKRYK